jgi:hypothetical protein
MDIKPNNIVQCDGKFKVIDYGLVSSFDKPLNGSGTPGYISPALFIALGAIFNSGKFNRAHIAAYGNLIDNNIKSYKVWKNNERVDNAIIYKVNDMFGVAVTLLELYSYHKIDDISFLESLNDLVKFPAQTSMPFSISRVQPRAPIRTSIPATIPISIPARPRVPAPTPARPPVPAPTPARPPVPAPTPTRPPVPAPTPARYLGGKRKSSRAAPIRKNN